MKTQNNQKTFPAVDSREITQLLNKTSMRYVSRSTRSERTKNEVSESTGTRITNRFLLTCMATEASLLELKTYPWSKGISTSTKNNPSSPLFHCPTIRIKSSTYPLQSKGNGSPLLRLWIIAKATAQEIPDIHLSLGSCLLVILGLSLSSLFPC